MPIFDYKCSDCGHACEIIQGFSDADETICPACGKKTFAKQISAPNFHLKGTGWYVTDFKDKKPTTDQTNTKSDKSA